METATTKRKRGRIPSKKEPKMHTALGHEWHESPEYSKFTPEQYANWDALKGKFYSSGKYGHDRPLPTNIKNNKEIIVVKLYGFKLPEPARIALCEVVRTKQKVAIAW